MNPARDRRVVPAAYTETLRRRPGARLWSSTAEESDDALEDLEQRSWVGGTGEYESSQQSSKASLAQERLRSSEDRET